MCITDRARGWGGLYRPRHNGEVERLLDDVIVGNGPYFSPAGHTLYFSDRRAGIRQFDDHPVTLTNPPAFFDAKAMNTACDCATVDTDGNIWSAKIGSGKIGCISPDSTLKLTVDLPIPLPSSIRFGGAFLEALFATSIRDSGNRKDTHPQSGLVFEVTGFGYNGLPEAPFPAKFRYKSLALKLIDDVTL